MSTYNRIPPELKGDFQARRRRALMEQFGLAYARPAVWLPVALMDQIERCTTDEAKRILLGVSK